MLNKNLFLNNSIIFEVLLILFPYLFTWRFLKQIVKSLANNYIFSLLYNKLRSINFLSSSKLELLLY